MLGCRFLPPEARARREDGKGGEREEPREIEIGPVGEDELEADDERGSESGELERRAATREERREGGAREDEPDQRKLHEMKVGDARGVVLPPVPDRERGLAAELPAERAIPGDPRRVGDVRFEEQDREGREGGRGEARGVEQRLTRPA
jgi:hypothetical protein